MSVFAMIFAVTYPLQPTQVTLISLFTIGIPSTFLALEPNHRRIEGNFFQCVIKSNSWWVNGYVSSRCLTNLW